MIQQGLKPGTSLKGATYRIEKVLGQGSFGITYLATAKFTTHGNLGKMDVEAKVAIKEFFMSDVNGRKEDGSTVEGSSGSVFSNYRKKFRNEAVNLSKLSHPNIVKVLDVFDENNTTYYIMEFLDGTNLDEYIRQCGSIREHEAIQIISEIGHALSYMHSQKMLHLDIKPKNIMRKSDGTTCLIDFGLAKQFNEDGEPESSTSIGLGTPGYAPIEQSGYKQDGTFPATLDVYALGATMFKMLTGKRPPDATNILNEGFPDTELSTSGVSDSTAAAVEKAMEPMKKNRYQNIGEFLSGFETTEIEDVTIIEAPVKPTTKKELSNLLSLLICNSNKRELALTDNASWIKATSNNTFNSYEEYLRRYKNNPWGYAGKHINEAKLKILRLQEAAQSAKSEILERFKSTSCIFPDRIYYKASFNEGINSLGGEIIITPTQLIFHPHKINFGNLSDRVFEISAISGYKKGILSCMYISFHDGSRIKLNVWSKDEIIAQLEARRTTLLKEIVTLCHDMR